MNKLNVKKGNMTIERIIRTYNLSYGTPAPQKKPGIKIPLCYTHVLVSIIAEYLLWVSAKTILDCFYNVRFLRKGHTPFSAKINKNLYLM